ncbi:SPRY domain-containing protein 3 [Phytophthora boehmeriae]|uniref:SPRY domain-containing protein 3 n=1 Tax=Phytophthora boehmeriae TaxID=109152 RepID=A0A8T1WNT0_9STRA|nr:SPRY domain-containing protein 3 [Phytophthora boehmeriae]
MSPGLTDLGDELLAYVLSYSTPRDVEAMTVASRVVARDVVPGFPSLWKSIFCRRWEALNFPLEGAATLEINKHLDALFPSSCSESRKYQLLAHAIVPVPSYADIQETQRALGYTDAYHRIISLQEPDLNESHVVDFALDGGMLGDDRCIRSNVPFPTTFHVAVYKINGENKANGRSRSGFEIGVVPGGYFELSLSERQHRHARTPMLLNQDAMTSIGVVNYKFPLIGKQPGWTRRSYGYHGDDGRYYHGTPYEGRAFGPMFKAGDTVGCGVHVNPSSHSMHVFFTHNGEVISGEDGPYMECEQRSWYPAVGMDAYDALHVNFGQEPFVHAGITDELFETCSGMADVISQHLRWHSISDSDEESLSEAETSDDTFGSDFSDEELGARLFMRILAMRRAGMVMEAMDAEMNEALGDA